MTYRLARINAALTRIGSIALASEADVGADAHVAIFDTIYEQLITRTDWTFATRVSQLSRLLDAPAQQWPYQFQLPTDMVGAPRAVYDNARTRTPMTDYQLVGDHLLTDRQAIWMRYNFLPEINRLPGSFAAALDMALMSEFALTIAMDRGLYQELRAAVYGTLAHGGDGGMLGEAMALDAQAKPSVVLAEGRHPLVGWRS